MKEIVKDPLEKGKLTVMTVTNEPVHCFHFRMSTLGE